MEATAATLLLDTPDVRKARGAFFTPEKIAHFIADWAIRDSRDSVLEPSCGDAAFLSQAVRVLQDRAGNPDEFSPVVDGVEIHPPSAAQARHAVLTAGGIPRIRVNDFFLEPARPEYSAVIGNPPFIRYQDFSGDARVRSREAALLAGVNLSGLASSWAAFAIHASLFLKVGGRMGLVLPAELLSVNYAAAVRRYLFKQFRQVDLVLFTERVFPEAEADVVLLLAEGFGQGPTEFATVFQAQNEHDLRSLAGARKWSPTDAGAKWTSSIVRAHAQTAVDLLRTNGAFADLESWGDTTLGMVTGNNKYFALSPQRASELGIPRRDLVRLSPPGSSHLRGLAVSDDTMTRLGRKGLSTWLFRPGGEPSAASAKYIEVGEIAGVHEAYKCRVRKPWWRVPLVMPADLLLTYMNADTPRLTTNAAGARHLNSVHGVYLKQEVRILGRELLPLASINSVTILAAETAGRSYGGGILKLEPREADSWPVPSFATVLAGAERLRIVRAEVARFLQRGKLRDAVRLVDEEMLVKTLGMSAQDLLEIRTAHAELAARRVARSESGR